MEKKEMTIKLKETTVIKEKHKNRQSEERKKTK